jgi:hypothetical protein
LEGCFPVFERAFRTTGLLHDLVQLERFSLIEPQIIASFGGYSRELRPAEWGSGVGLHGSNLKLLTYALGHVWTAPWQELSDVAAALAGITAGE